MSDATPIVPAYMAHIVLQTRDKEQLVNWYKTVFYANELYSNETLTFLTFDDEHHRFAILQLPPDSPERDQRAPGVAHFAYTYNGIDDLQTTYLRLKDAGIEPFLPVNHGLTVSLYYNDPDGNAVELQVDAFDTPEACKAVFSSEAFNANPFGARYNPDVFFAAYQSGKAVSEAMQEAEAAMG